ncbi:uncharacterized protein BDZ99DRAFT_459997 [Mytilinidion resinicola]|uniref:Uncharacterized protein n=1 Tax=Mytilinidion resinicola TaxID=574789 RepID=A0A6A6Z0R2_9PEZI|nr:uncharacterized protein BDZ99DRAFT_459997 [Mytilinidion resinicola]KAF2814309.1 hypothetical protein BDZ99DRAFT_459997 [Mytilinidion resinicola]
MKIDNNAAMSHPYEVEYSCKDSRTWYDLSSLDGSPFVTNRRFVQVGDAGQCPTIFWTYNDQSCEWPVQKDCHNGGPLSFYLC